MKRTSSTRRLLFAAFIAVAMAACTMKTHEVPPLSGPSELGTSVVVSVSPDILTQDGGSQSVVTVIARDPNGQPLRNISMRNEIYVDGFLVDFGTLSARNIVTGSDGKATFVYTAPLAPTPSVDTYTLVTILVTPVGTDFGNSTSRLATIRLVPPGVVVPPDGMQPAFDYNPRSPEDHQSVFFDASASRSTSSNAIVGYSWTFGDGGTATGKTATHAYSAPGSYVVTLTVSDSFNRTAQTSQIVTVGAGDAPTAAFSTSPDTPAAGENVNFNASSSKAASGRTIRTYAWDFGDGDQKTTSTPNTTHDFLRTGTFTVTLTVTDDAGRIGSTTQSVTVGNDSPTAVFTTSPTSPLRNQVASFNGAGSTARAGRTIVSYHWDFGGPSATPPTQGPSSNSTGQASYSAAGTYSVTLTVVDSAGKVGRVTNTVTVQ